MLVNLTCGGHLRIALASSGMAGNYICTVKSVLSGRTSLGSQKLLVKATAERGKALIRPLTSSFRYTYKTWSTFQHLPIGCCQRLALIFYPWVCGMWSCVLVSNKHHYWMPSNCSCCCLSKTQEEFLSKNNIGRHDF